MKKRILSLLLTLCMVLSIAPTAAFAEGEGNTNTGKAISYEFIFCAFILRWYAMLINIPIRTPLFPTPIRYSSDTDLIGFLMGPAAGL